MIIAIALPALVIIAEIVMTIMIYAFSPAEVVGGISSEPWHRIYRAAYGLHLLSAVAVAVLFFAGLGRWSRAEGSWMSVMGAFLAIVAGCVGFSAVVIETAIDDPDVLLDLRVHFVWFDIAQTFGLMAIGFFFLAYRGLSEGPARQA